MIPELLAPAGSMECLETALDFGADAVYAAGASFGLRASAPNLSIEQLKEASQIAHSLGRKLYTAVNALVREDELDDLRCYLQELGDIELDGIIFSDPSVISICRQLQVPHPLHLSTQASTMNSAACSFWRENGVQRIVLGREASLADVKRMRAALPQDMELEVFVHGAMCIAHSGRCLLSSVATGRSGNRGECAQPCRWEYEIREKGTHDAWSPVSVDSSGTYILNSRDLMMLDKIPELVLAGVSSLKIEGRMKSAYYVASVVSAYRAALDLYRDCGERATPEMMEELEKSATRSYTRGFFFGNPGGAGEDTTRRTSPRKYTFAARVLEDTKDGYITVEQRNKFSVGDTLEILSPAVRGAAFIVESIRTLDGEQRTAAPHAQETLLVQCPHNVRRGALLRRPEHA